MPREKVAKQAADKLFDLIGVRSPGDPQAFVAAVISLFTHYPLRVLRAAIDPYHGIPGQRGRKQAWESEIEFYKKTLDELHAPILREEERLHAEIEKRRTRLLALPAPPRTAEQQERIDQQVADARKRLGIPPAGLQRDKFIARPSDELPINSAIMPRQSDGKHDARVAADLAQRKGRST
jgi:hypothetical protein